MDTDLAPLRSAESGELLTLKEVVYDRMIALFEAEQAEANRNPLHRFSIDDGGPGAASAAYSAILFGPPGTAKTTICEAVARRLGWSFLVVDTSAFLAEGLGNVAARLTHVFDRLCRLENTVILFDEIEEFCLDRETPGLGMESRMLTTSMLTKINDLRRGAKDRQTMFFVATNRLRAFDSAVTRPGRFDLQLFVGTPNCEARVARFQNRLASISGGSEGEGANAAAVGEAVATFREFLAEQWEEDAMFLNYMEAEQFAAAAERMIASGQPLTKMALALILRNQAATMVVRGSVRDEYRLSMGLSRI